MEVSEIISLAGLLATALIAILTIHIQGKRLKEQAKREERLVHEQLERQEKSHLAQLKREDEIRKLNREDQAHIEFSMDCNLFGPQKGQFLAEVVLMANNKGSRLQKFPEITLRIRGIKKGEELSISNRLGIVDFSHPILKETNIIPKNLNFYFVEPHVNQRFTFTTLIKEDYKFICLHATFHYDESTPHSVENVVEVISEN